jgi:hypothetical protein
MKRHCKTKGVFIGRGGSRRNSNGHRFDCRAPTHTRHLGNHA